MWRRLGLASAVALTLASAGPGVHPISGREYARPMGVAGAPWLDREEREAEEAPTRALAILQIAPGSTVADIGAGSGYFTERLARLVGPSGKVYANDIQAGMLDLLRRRLSREQMSNVTLVLGAPADPKLPAGAVDLALMVDVYHELSDPQTMLAHIRQGAQTRRPARAHRVQRRRRIDSDPAGAQDDRRASRARSGARRVHLDDGQLQFAAAARARVFDPATMTAAAVTCGQTLARTLRDAGVAHMFGLPGGGDPTRSCEAKPGGS